MNTNEHYVYDAFSQIRAQTSTIKKLEILGMYSKNKELKKYFLLSVDPSIKFYVKKIPSYSNPNSETGKSLTWAYEQLTVLSSRAKTGNAAIDHLRNILENMSDKNARLIKNIINKESKCGIAFKGVNKIWKNAIKKEPYQRFQKESEKAWSEMKYPFISTVKEDGEFSDIQIRGSIGSNHIITRGSKTLDFKGYFDPILEKLHALDDFVMMAEILVWDDENHEFMNRQKGNGIINSNIPDHMLEHIHFRCINIVPWDNFIEGYDPSHYEDRLNFTQSIIDVLSHPQFHVVSWAEVFNRDEADIVHQKRREQGLEGSVIYNKDLPWENTDSGTKGSMKQKQRENIDMIITDWKPFKATEGEWDEDDERQNWIGSLKCESSDGKVVVWVGSMKDKYRRMDPNDLVGKITVVAANDVTDNEFDDLYSLFLPGYAPNRDNIVRDDKTDADSFEEICIILKAKRFMNKAKRVTKKSKINATSKVVINETSTDELEW